jgi:hypothetical protein
VSSDPRSISDRLADEYATGKADLDRPAQLPGIPAPEPELKSLARSVRAIKQVLDALTGAGGSVLDKVMTTRELLKQGALGYSPSTGLTGGSGNTTIISGGGSSGGGSGYTDPRPVLSTPPTPTALDARGAFKTVVLDWGLSNYRNHAYVEVFRNTVDVRGSATLIAQTTANIFVDADVTVGSTYYYWVRAVNIEGAVGSDNAFAGTSAGLLRVGNTDLGPLVVEASNIANTTITSLQLGPNSVIAGKISTNAIVAGDGAIANLAITNGLIGNLAVDDGKIANLSAAKITFGTMSGDRIAANTLDANRIATGTLSAAQVTFGTMSGARIATNTLDASAITTGTLSANQITVGTMSGDRIVAGTITGSTLTGGVVQTSASGGKQVVISAATNEAQFFGNGGAGVGMVGSIGLNTFGGDVVVGNFGQYASGFNATGVLAQSFAGTALKAKSFGLYGVDAESSSNVYAGVSARNAGSGPGLNATSVTGYGIEVFGNSTKPHILLGSGVTSNPSSFPAGSLANVNNVLKYSNGTGYKNVVTITSAASVLGAVTDNSDPNLATLLNQIRAALISAGICA